MIGNTLADRVASLYDKTIYVRTETHLHFGKVVDYGLDYVTLNDGHITTTFPFCCIKQIQENR